ncbi:hypothetical protein E4K10_48255 [Streptomyces sp. T1317-0309]|nr:hypothetical protein E4K10_48255 [Streptomyces sp. T1317-0309]
MSGIGRTGSPHCCPRWSASRETPVASYDLLTAGRRQHLLSGVGEGAVCASLPELLRRQAERTPDAPALDSDGETLTYAQLTDRVEHLAGALVARGAGPGTTVAVAFGRGAAATTAALAVQHTGAAHLPLDPAGPVHRLRHMFDDAHPVLLVTEPDAPTPYAPTGLPVLELDESAFAAAPAPPRVPAPQQAAYLLYTSGTTGRPKGVVVPHAASRASQGTSPGCTASRRAAACSRSPPRPSTCPSPRPRWSSAPAPPWSRRTRSMGRRGTGQAHRGEADHRCVRAPALFEGVSPDQCPDLRTVGLSGEACGAAWSPDGSPPGVRSSICTAPRRPPSSRRTPASPTKTLFRRSADRFPEHARTSWIPCCARCPSACRASCTWRGTDWPGATRANRP